MNIKASPEAVLTSETLLQALERHRERMHPQEYEGARAGLAVDSLDGVTVSSYGLFLQRTAVRNHVMAAQIMIEEVGPSSEVMHLRASSNGTCVVRDLCWPGDVVCDGKLVIERGVVGGRITAPELSFGELAVGSEPHVEGRIANASQIKRLAVEDPYSNVTFLSEVPTESIQDLEVELMGLDYLRQSSRASLELQDVQSRVNAMSTQHSLKET